MLSVIIPVYNAEQWLVHCLESVLGSDYSDIEVLLVNDGSEDKSDEICKSFAAKDERIRYFCRENRGTSGARNFALDEIKGEWVTFVDSDDWIEPSLYCDVMAFALDNNLDAVCFGMTIYKNNKFHKIDLKYKENQIFTRDECMHEVFSYTIDNAVSDKIYKAELFKGIRFPVGRIYEDVATVYKALYNANKVGYLLHAGYIYNIHLGSNIHNKGINPTVRYQQFSAYKERIDFCKEKLIDTEDASVRAMHSALGAMTAFYVNGDSISSDQYGDVLSFMEKYNTDEVKRGLGLKKRFLLWAFFKCNFLFRLYASPKLRKKTN